MVTSRSAQLQPRGKVVMTDTGSAITWTVGIAIVVIDPGGPPGNGQIERMVDP